MCWPSATTRVSGGLPLLDSRACEASAGERYTQMMLYVNASFFSERLTASLSVSQVCQCLSSVVHTHHSHYVRPNVDTKEGRSVRMLGHPPDCIMSMMRVSVPLSDSINVRPTISVYCIVLIPRATRAIS